MLSTMNTDYWSAERDDIGRLYYREDIKGEHRETGASGGTRVAQRDGWPALLSSLLGRCSLPQP
jgi:hypothetical protein